MPVTPTYPGVYIQEIPSGVHTITGVATSITAFIGRAQRGPVNKPVTINSYADFQRVFGGLWTESSLGYAVRDFYLNGGSQAIIVRLFRPYFATADERDTAVKAATAVVDGMKNKQKAKTAARAAREKADSYTDDVEKMAANIVATAAESAAQQADEGDEDAVIQAAQAAVDVVAPITNARLDANGLFLEAASAGSWGNDLRARVDHDVMPANSADLFNLSIRDGNSGQVEVFRNVSAAPGHPRQVDKVLANESRLVHVAGALPPIRPDKHADPGPGDDVWSDHDPATSSKVEAGKKSSDGSPLKEDDFTGPGQEGKKQGLYALERADLFNLLCIPPYNKDGNVDDAVLTAAATYCERRRAMLIIDPPADWMDKDAAKSGISGIHTTSPNAAVFFPRLRQPNPQRDNQVEDFAPCGAVAGVMARTDSRRGVWKAPAGMDATLNGVPQLSVPLTDAENGELNPLGINCLRAMPAVGPVIWGARTRQGDDRLASEWKYIPVRRLALYIEESLYRGTQWAVFEPNDEPLWAQVRLNVGAFMHDLFRKGAFQGRTPREAYFVKCDRETTTQNDINNGIVNIIVGFAPLKPAEFVIISLQQMAGQIQV